MYRAAIACGVPLVASALLIAQQPGNAPKMDPSKFLTQPLVRGRW